MQYHRHRKQRSGGYAMLTAVMFFLFASSVIILGTSSSVLREMQVASNLFKTKASYFTSESGSEDVLYRLKNGSPVSTSETVSLDGFTVTTLTTTGVSGEKIISSQSDRLGYTRKVTATLDPGASVSFFYGVQAGAGGLYLNNTASVVGNVYSNGPVVGTASISSNPDNPTYISQVTVGPTAYRAVLGGAYVYVVNENTVQTVSISNPASPTVVSTVTNGGQQKDIALANGHIFVTATNDNVVRAFSLSNPTTPSYVGSIAVTGANQIKASGSYIYVLSSTGSHTLKTIDVSNPSTMSVVASVNTVSTFPVGLAIQGSYLYVISQGGTSKLEVYSLANPASPTLVSATTIGTNPITIAINGSYAYIDVYACGCIQVFNISNPAAPVIVSSTAVNSLNNGYSLYVAGSYLYAAVYYGTKEFQVWDISNPSLLSKINTINISAGNPIHIIPGPSGYIYLLTQNNNATSPLRIYRVTGSGGNTISGDVVSAGSLVEVANNSAVTNPINPPLVGSVSVGNIAPLLGALDFAFHPTDPFAYVLSSTGIEVVQLTNPNSPVVIKTISGGYSSNPYFTFMIVSGNYLYISGINSNAVDVWSLASASNPVKIKQVSLGSPKNAYTMTVVGNYLYVPLTGVSSSMAIINITDPANAAVVNTITTPLDPIRVVSVGSYAYLFSQDGNYSKITVYSVASPANPVAVKTLSGIVNNSVRDPSYQQGSFLYGLSRGLSNIHILNVSNPANPTLAYIQPYNSTLAGSMWGFGGYLYIPIDHRYAKSIEVWSISGSTPPVKVSTINNVPGGTGSYWRTEVHNGYLYYLNGVNNATGSSLGVYRISPDAPSFVSTGRIEKINATASMYASTIKDSIAGANAYFKNISNTTVLGTSYPNSADQATGTMPISDDQISSWEAEAVAGGTATCDGSSYDITDTVNLGPKKIPCDLNISNNAVVSLTGTVWVTGNITVSNSAVVKVSSSLPGKTIPLIADKTSDRSSSSQVYLSNNVTVEGSGTNSFVLFVSQNNSAENGGENNAIVISNSLEGAILLYAPHGNILLSNSVKIKEVTGYKITANNSAQIIYESGIANLIFTSGPAGGYSIGGWGASQ